MKKQETLIEFNNSKRGTWFVSVLNTENGREWIKRFHKLNPNLKITSYPRHSNWHKMYNEIRKNNDRRAEYTYTLGRVPAKYCERRVLYIERKFA